MLTLPNKNLSGTIGNGKKDSLRYSKINQKAPSGKQIKVVRMAAAASRTPSLCQLRHAARWDPEDSARGQVQAGRGAEPDGGSHHLSPPHPMLICKHSGKSLSLFKVDEGWYPLYTFSPLLLHLHSSGQTCAGALRCIVSTSVKSVMEPKVLINNPDEARKF